jgi:hypothetical protein
MKSSHADREFTQRETTSNSPRFMRKFFISLAVLVIIVGGCYGWYRSIYPYGHSHCCDKQLYTALYCYAELNGGNFPSGEATPEASLSLIHATYEYGYAYLLCGKSGSEPATQAILERGELLGPDSCGWNYVEDLRMNDDSRLALFWDKEGLGHNGERLPDGGHWVTMVHGMSEYIPAKEWSAFLAEQKELYAQRLNTRKKRLRNRAPKPE